MCQYLISYEKYYRKSENYLCKTVQECLGCLDENNSKTVNGLAH